MYNIRFYLKNGENYKNWIIKKGDFIEFYSPDKYSLILYNCRLRNIPKLSRNILQGGKKTKCGWIECDDYLVLEKTHVDISNKSIIRFNPKFMPFWINEKNEKIDDSFYNIIKTYNRTLYV